MSSAEESSKNLEFKNFISNIKTDIDMTSTTTKTMCAATTSSREKAQCKLPGKIEHNGKHYCNKHIEAAKVQPENPAAKDSTVKRYLGSEKYRPLAMKIAEKCIPLIDKERSRDRQMFYDIGKSIWQVFRNDHSEKGIKLWQQCSIDQVQADCLQEYRFMETSIIDNRNVAKAFAAAFLYTLHQHMDEGENSKDAIEMTKVECEGSSNVYNILVDLLSSIDEECSTLSKDKATEEDCINLIIEYDEIIRDIITEKCGSDAAIKYAKSYGITYLKKLAKIDNPAKYAEMKDVIEGKKADPIIMEKAKFGDGRMYYHAFEVKYRGMDFHGSKADKIDEILMDLRSCYACTSTGEPLEFQVVRSFIPDDYANADTKYNYAVVYNKKNPVKFKPITFKINNEEMDMMQITEPNFGLYSYEQFDLQYMDIKKSGVLNIFLGYRGQMLNDEEYGKQEKYVKIINENLRDVLCGEENNKQEVANYIENILAWRVQNKEHHRVMPVFCSVAKSIGKSEFLDFVGSRIIGPGSSYCLKTLRDFLGKEHNAHVLSKSFVYVNEIHANEKEMEEFKSYLSDTRHHLRDMHKVGKNVYTNMLYMGATNHTFTNSFFSSSDGDSRFCPISCSASKKDDKAYVKNVQEAYKNGANAYYTYLMKRSIDKFDPSKIPVTKLMAEGKISNKHEIEQFFNEDDEINVLSNGTVDAEKTYDRYKEWSKKTGREKFLTKQWFCKKGKELGVLESVDSRGKVWKITKK